MTFPQPDYAAAPTALAPTADSRRNVPGRASLVAGVILGVVGIAQQLYTYAIPTLIADLALPSSAYSLLFLPFTIVSALLAVAAIILGIIGLTRRGAPKAAAGAGTALGVATLVSVVVGLLGGAIASALL